MSFERFKAYEKRRVMAVGLGHSDILPGKWASTVTRCPVPVVLQKFTFNMVYRPRWWQRFLGLVIPRFRPPHPSNRPYHPTSVSVSVVVDGQKVTLGPVPVAYFNQTFQGADWDWDHYPEILCPPNAPIDVVVCNNTRFPVTVRGVAAGYNP